jgi:hypothetical protein
VAQCEAEGVPDRINEVRALLVQALGSPSVVEAASLPHSREIYSCTPHEGRLLEGYIDLLYRASEGLVVVDFTSPRRPLTPKCSINALRATGCREPRTL